MTVRFHVFLSIVIILTAMHVMPVCAEEAARAQEGAGRQMVQVSINATVLIDDFSETTRKLNDICAQFKGKVQSLNFDSNNTSGSVQILVPPAKAPLFMAEIQCLGEVQNQSLSTSDYGRSYRDAKQKLRCYEHLSQIPPERLGSAVGLAGEDKAAFLEEFYSSVRNQITNARSNMENYEKNGENATAVIYLKKRSNQNANTTTVQVAEIPRDSGGKSPEGSRSDFMLMLPVYLLILLILIMIYRLHRLIRKTPIGS